MKPRLKPIDFIPRIGYRTFHRRATHHLGMNTYGRYLERSDIEPDTRSIYASYLENWRFKFMYIYHRPITALSDLFECVGKKTGF